MTKHATYSDEEINKFNALAARWWDPSGPFKPLHALNPLRLAFIEDQFNLAGKHVLDVGCGGGILTERLAQAGAQVTGIDLAPEVIKIARAHAHAQNLNIDYQCISIDDFAHTHPAGFDGITCMELLEHVPDPSLIIAHCARLLKPQGQLFLSTLNRNLQSFLFAIVGAEYILKLLPTGTHEYAKFITPAELARFLRVENFEVEQLRGMSYQPLKGEFQLSNNTQVNYLLSARFMHPTPITTNDTHPPHRAGGF